MISNQSDIDKLALEFLRKLEYKKGDIVSYEDFLTKVRIVCNLEGRGESFISHMFDLIESASFIKRHFSIHFAIGECPK